jgi:hypothetical protein
MKRRTFIKSIGTLSALAGVSPAMAWQNGQTVASHFNHLNGFTLKEFEDEHEEYPTLVTDHHGQSWLFSLRRLPFPEDKELISAFKLEGGTWKEIKPVSNNAGQYEYPTAVCAPKGKPVVAWTSFKNNQWTIEACIGTKEGFSEPVSFQSDTGKYINPVLFANSAKKTWLAWEKLDQGQFSICITKNENGQWNEVVEIASAGNSLFDPALVEDTAGILFVAYGITDGVHQNIEMRKLDGNSLDEVEKIPVAIGGGLKDRVNINSHPALGLDKSGRLWVSWENNRKTHRLEDGDNFTGDRICAMACYEDGILKESKTTGKWLFDGINDHLPTFIKNKDGELFAITHCGGDFTGNPFWKYRISKLDVKTGWSKPEMLLETKQKGQTNRPSMIIDEKAGCWLTTRPEKWFEDGLEVEDSNEGQHRARLSKLELHQFDYKESKPVSSGALELVPTVVEEYHPAEGYVSISSGRPKIERKTMEHNGETYTLLLGNLHEHTEISSCWPAGCDGTIHDDYRFGIYSEGYDFMGITDHGYSLNEVYWRKNLRMANFYTDDNHFVALPSLEWTLSNGKGNIEIKPGAGHKNVIFPSNEEALKFIRNKDEIYSVRNGETKDAMALWEFLHENDIDCITIPHHPADEVHATDWEVHDEKYQPIVEIFQCRGNAEYPGCPRVINVTRHKPTPNTKAFIDYALAEKGYQMGFIASGDHNGIGIGIAAVWVKEVSAKGIVEGLRNRRCFGTTGDKIFVNLTVNGSWANDQAKILGSTPEIQFEVEAVNKIRSLELLRNSKVIKSIKVDGSLKQNGTFTDVDYASSSDVLYYYLRVIQENKHIGWSSPVWVTKES